MPAKRTRNGVPILEISDESAERLAAVHAAAMDPGDDSEGYRTGAVVYLHNKVPADSDSPTRVETVHIGGSTLDEAVKEVITIFDTVLSLDDPTWVASTDGDIAELLAEHYNCEVKGMDEELSA